MNVPTELAGKVIDQLRGTPFVLTIMVLNIIVLAGFWVALSHVGDAMERREKIIERCFK